MNIYVWEISIKNNRGIVTNINSITLIGTLSSPGGIFVRNRENIFPAAVKTYYNIVRLIKI
jgi:hypothetical protein